MSDETPPDVPLIEIPGATPYNAPVINLAEIRIALGYSDRKVGTPCEHRDLTYSREERRVWCCTCERTIENFDAFKMFADYFHDMEFKAQQKLKRAAEAEALTINLRSAKVFDKAWRGPNQMAVCCPHCNVGLLPEDFVRGTGQRSAELERARRARAAKDGSK